MNRKNSVVLTSIIAASLCAFAAQAAEITVTARVTQWDPLVVFAKPGDSIRFVSMSGHDTAAIEGMIPEGAEMWHSKMGEEYSVTVQKEGAYVYKCTPHVSEGMVGVIIVGDQAPANWAAIESNPANKSTVARAVRKAKKALEEKGFKL